MFHVFPPACRWEARQLPDVVTVAAAQQQQQQDKEHATDQQTAAGAPHSQQERGQGQGQEGREQGRRGGIRNSRYYAQLLAADESVPACDPSLQPSAAWTRDFLSQFAQLRRRLQR